MQFEISDIKKITYELLTEKCSPALTQQLHFSNHNFIFYFFFAKVFFQ